jgi:hypothetical protein
VAYNPLAAGMLSGKHAGNSGDVLQGRFKVASTTTTTSFRLIVLLHFNIAQLLLLLLLIHN